MKYDIFGLDRPCVDFTVDINQIPERNKGCLLNGIGWQGGGKVSTGMVAAARLGANCAIAGKVGDDLYGKFCREDFLRHGINVDQMNLTPGCTTDLGVVLSERSSATRTILYRFGSTPSLQEEDVDWSDLKESRLLFVAQTTGISGIAMDYAKKWNIPIFIDADTYSESMERRIGDITYFVASEFVFNAMFPGHGDKPLEDMEPECREILNLGPEVAVFTFGSRGCVGCSKQEGFFSLPAFSVEVRDTVGAGDVFHGAFLTMLLKGKSIRDCARYASGTSAIKCTFPGGRAGIPTEEILEKFLRTGVIDDTELSLRAKYYERGIEHVST